MKMCTDGMGLRKVHDNQEESGTHSQITADMRGGVKFSSQKTYNTGLTLLRCIIMLFVVIHHSIVHGIDLYSLDKINIEYSMGIFINAFVIVGVNCFFLLSGYFGVDFKKNKLVRLHIQMVIYGLSAYFLAILFGFVNIDNIVFLKTVLLPELFYWFMMVYCILMIFAAPLNIMLRETDKDKLMKYIVVAVMIEFLGLLTDSRILGMNYGYSVFHGGLMYAIGFYISNYGKDTHLNKYKMMYIALSILNILMNGIIFKTLGINFSRVFFSYCNPIVIISSVAFFVCFIDIKFDEKKKKIISTISRSTLPVYLITDHISVQKIIYRPISLLLNKYGEWIFGIAVVSYSLFLYFICITIVVFFKKCYIVFMSRVVTGHEK